MLERKSCGIQAMRLFSYVVEHDTGHAPNPYFCFCTLCRCKYRSHRGGRPNVIGLARRAKEKGEVVWVVGTGGTNRNKSAGNGKIVYAMRVDEVLSREEYYKDPRFQRKKPLRSGAMKSNMGTIFGRRADLRSTSNTSLCQRTSTTSEKRPSGFHLHCPTSRREEEAFAQGSTTPSSSGL